MAESGIKLIEAERQRQIVGEGWSREHDRGHTAGELAMAAAAYAIPAERRKYRLGEESPGIWPWEDADWKPTPTDRVRELVKAGALIAAEIDRLRSNPPAEVAALPAWEELPPPTDHLGWAFRIAERARTFVDFVKLHESVNRDGTTPLADFLHDDEREAWERLLSAVDEARAFALAPRLTENATDVKGNRA